MVLKDSFWQNNIIKDQTQGLFYRKEDLKQQQLNG